MIKWISTKSKLPNCNPGSENPHPVLYALKKTGTVRIGYYGEMGTYRDKYFREYHDTTEGTDVDDVSHWMFAPEAPENDE